MRVALLVVALCACAPRLPAALDELRDPEPVIAHVAAPPGSIEELRARIAKILEREGVPGVAIALVGRDGPTWIGGVGVANAETRMPMGAETVVRAASITKSIVGLGVMRLAEQGRLRLDQPIRELVPDAGIDNAWEGSSPVTIAQVLEHTAGLDDMRPSETFVDDDAMSTSAALALNRNSRVIRWRPGTRGAYSNVGYTLAARAIEGATGVPFDAWLRDNVTRPLGMPDADFRITDVLGPRLATGYDEDGIARYRPIAHRAAGALLASAKDLANLVQFWLRRGDGFPAIVSPAGLERIERTGTLPYPKLDIEYGLGNYGDVAHPVKARGHDGGLPGFASCLRYFPELGVGYVMLLNSTKSRTAFGEIRGLLFAYLTRDRTVPLPDEAPAAGTAALDGYYAFASPRHALFGFLERALLGWKATKVEGGARLESLVGPTFELVATRDGGYRLPGQSGTSFRFTENRDGERVLIGLVGYAEPASWSVARMRVWALQAALVVMELAPWWAALAIAIALARRRRIHALDLLPALPAILLPASVYVLDAGARRQVLGELNGWTLGVFATTLLFGLAAFASLAVAAHAAIRRERLPLWRRAVPTASAVASAALAAWFAVHGLVGLRTWSW